MKNSGLVWFFIGGIIVTVFIAFNYQTEEDIVPLSEIFPDEGTVPIEFEYEFVDGTPKLPAPPVRVSAPPKPKVQTVVKTAAVKPPTPPPPPKKSAAKTTTQKRIFKVQVASFKDRARAEKMLAKVKEKGYTAEIGSANLKDKGTWYRVYIGKFNTKAAAEKTLSSVKKDFKSGLIISSSK